MCNCFAVRRRAVAASFCFLGAGVERRGEFAVNLCGQLDISVTLRMFHTYSYLQEVVGMFGVVYYCFVVEVQLL